MKEKRGHHAVVSQATLFAVKGVACETRDTRECVLGTNLGLFLSHCLCYSFLPSNYSNHVILSLLLTSPTGSRLTANKQKTLFFHKVLLFTLTDSGVQNRCASIELPSLYFCLYFTTETNYLCEFFNKLH